MVVGDKVFPIAEVRHISVVRLEKIMARKPSKRAAARAVRQAAKTIETVRAKDCNCNICRMCKKSLKELRAAELYFADTN